METMGVTPSFWKGKNVFVTGHTGFKGAWLCKILNTLGACVTGFALEPLTQPGLYNLCRTDVNSIVGDIRDFNGLAKAYESAYPEIVIHMAAQTLVLESYRQTRYTYDVNVMGTVNILECVRQFCDANSFLNVTTDKVYLNFERLTGYCEDEQLNGYDPYANSKSCSELVTSSYNNIVFKEQKIPISTARSGNAIGGGDFAENRIVPDCARFLAKGETVQIRNVNSVRPYQHVLDTLFAYLLILERQWENPAVSGAYNIAPDEGDCLTSGQIAQLFCEAWGAGAEWESVSVDNPHEDNLLRLNCSKIKGTFGWKSLWNIQAAVNETAAWYKAFYECADYLGIMERQIDEYIAHYSALG